MTPNPSKRLTASPSQVLLLAALLVIGTLQLVHSGWLQRLDLMVYDLLLTTQQQPPPDEIAIIAIDEASLQQIGRWPWSRRVHARLIDRLTEAGSRAVALDLPLNQPDRRDPAADQALAEAMARNKRVVLAVAPKASAGLAYRAEARPVPLLARNAAALGHIDVQLDPDGRCRRIYLHAGMDHPRWPAMALALHSIGEGHIGHRRAPSDRVDQVGNWVRQQPILIPYLGRDRHFRYHSYADVLEGRVDPAALKDRYVLVGGATTHLGRKVSIPIAQPYHRMPGMEVDANLLAALLRQHLVSEAPIWLRNMLTVFLVGAPLVVLIARGNRHALPILGAAELLTLLLTAALLFGPGLWFPPGAPLLTLAVAYLLLNRLKLRRSVQEAARSARHNWRATMLDGLTGLPVKERLVEALQSSLPEQSKQGKLLALLVINLKGFKIVNDRLGRSAADQLLTRVVKRTRQVVRQDDLMVRLGKDEFAVMMAGLDDRRPVEGLANRIRAALRDPFDTQPDPVFLSAHFAAALYPADGRDTETLLQSADTAMRLTRERELQNVGFRADQRLARADGRSDLEAALEDALEGDELQIHFQPQISARNERVIGVEALLRWVSPRFGAVPPAEFLPIAERSGAIVPIGAWVLEQACEQAQHWLDQGLPGLRMAVNVSSVQLARAGLVDTVREVLKRTGMDAGRLELELNNSCLPGAGDTLADTLSALKQLGVRLSFDDFGAGYNTLHRLKPLPFDGIKIDRSLTADIQAGNATAGIVREIISMAHDRKLQVVAEGVETAEQKDFLLGQGCDRLQGYLFARPLPAEDLEPFLRRKPQPPPRREAPPVAAAS